MDFISESSSKTSEPFSDINNLDSYQSCSVHVSRFIGDWTMFLLLYNLTLQDLRCPKKKECTNNPLSGDELVRNRREEGVSKNSTPYCY